MPSKRRRVENLKQHPAQELLKKTEKKTNVKAQ